jgi:carbonic anhydrase
LPPDGRAKPAPGTFIDRARAFGQESASRGQEFRHLAEGQWPQVLFIACSDSRVIPSLITRAGPGELYELRTAGAFIPAYRRRPPSSETATIEYALEVLNVTDVVVCGHSHCAAVAALARGEDMPEAPAMSGWVRRAVPNRAAYASASTDPALIDAGKCHVLVQMERLRGYPSVRRRVAEGRTRLHGWFYEVHTGAVLAHRSRDNAFAPL